MPKEERELADDYSWARARGTKSNRVAEGPMGTMRASGEWITEGEESCWMDRDSGREGSFGWTAVNAEKRSEVAVVVVGVSAGGRGTVVIWKFFPGGGGGFGARLL